MTIMNLVKMSLKSLWEKKHLWFLGFFVATATGGGASYHAGGGTGFLPVWVVPAILGGAVLAIAFAVMHMISEGALIEAIGRERNNQETSLRAELASGRRHMWQILGIKLVYGGISFLLVALVGLPVLGMVTETLPFIVGVPLAVIGGVIALPGLLTIHMLMQYALRFCVLDGRATFDALRLSKRHLVDRMMESIKMLLAAALGNIAGTLALAVVMLPGVLLGGIAYLVGGMIAGIVVGSLVAMPLIVALIGARGTFHSALWTHGFAEQVCG